VAERPVATGTEARAGSKEGVVRYVLLARWCWSWFYSR
jgi:hypothetical protein